MIKQSLLLFIHATCFFLLFFLSSAYGADKFETKVLISLEWGKKKGEFGFDKSGKTEAGYMIDFIKTEDSIYLIDPMNNRIQVFLDI